MKCAKRTIRQYYKRIQSEVEQPWTQPVLSANGVIGGDSFACAASSVWVNDTWNAFDNNTDTYVYLHANPQWIEWYNPNPLKISKVRFTTKIVGIQVGNLQFSDDGITWTNIYSINHSGSGYMDFTMDITNLTNSHKYWRIYVITADGYLNAADFSEITITATELATTEVIVPGTADDYDYYEDVSEYQMLIEEGQKEVTKPNANLVGTYVHHDQVVTGFSDTSYAKMPELVDFGNGSWEMVFKVHYMTNSLWQTICTSVSSDPYGGAEDGESICFGLQWYIGTNNLFSLSLSSTDNSWDICQAITGGTLTTNTDYYLKLSFTGTQYIMQHSTDGEIWVTNITINNTNKIQPRHYMIGLSGTNSTHPWIGSFDFSESYIKAGDEIVWSGTKTEQVTIDKYYAFNK